MLDLATGESLGVNGILCHQNKITDYLNTEKTNINASLIALKKLTTKTMKIQYLSFPKRFLLLLEGSEADSRKKIIKLTEFYCATKIKNQLSAAFGAWKIYLCVKNSEINLRIYSKKAGAILMVEWVRNFIKKILFSAMKR